MKLSLDSTDVKTSTAVSASTDTKVSSAVIDSLVSDNSSVSKVTAVLRDGLDKSALENKIIAGLASSDAVSSTTVSSKLCSIYADIQSDISDVKGMASSFSALASSSMSSFGWGIVSQIYLSKIRSLYDDVARETSFASSMFSDSGQINKDIVKIKDFIRVYGSSADSYFRINDLLSTLRSDIASAYPGTVLPIGGYSFGATLEDNLPSFSLSNASMPDTALASYASFGYDLASSDSGNRIEKNIWASDIGYIYAYYTADSSSPQIYELLSADMSSAEFALSSSDSYYINASDATMTTTGSGNDAKTSYSSGIVDIYKIYDSAKAQIALPRHTADDASSSFPASYAYKRFETLYDSSLTAPSVSWSGGTLNYLGSMTADTITVHPTDASSVHPQNGMIGNSVAVSRTVSFTPYSGDVIFLAMSGTLQYSVKSSTAAYSVYRGTLSTVIDRTQTVSKSVILTIKPVSGSAAFMTLAVDSTSAISTSTTALSNEALNSYVMACLPFSDLPFTETVGITAASFATLRLLRYLITICDYLSSWGSDANRDYAGVFSIAYSKILACSDEIDAAVSDSIKAIQSVADTYSVSKAFALSQDSSFSDDDAADLTSSFTSLASSIATSLSADDYSAANLYDGSFLKTISSWMNSCSLCCYAAIASAASCLERSHDLFEKISYISGSGSVNFPSGSLQAMVFQNVLMGTSSSHALSEVTSGDYVTFSFMDFGSWLNGVLSSSEMVYECTPHYVFPMLYICSAAEAMIGESVADDAVLTLLHSIQCERVIDMGKSGLLDECLSVSPASGTSLHSKDSNGQLRYLMDTSRLFDSAYGISLTDDPNAYRISPLAELLSPLFARFDSFDMDSIFAVSLSDTSSDDEAYVRSAFPHVVDTAYLICLDSVSELDTLFSDLKNIYSFTANGTSSPRLSLRKMSVRDIVMLKAFSSAAGSILGKISSSNDLSNEYASEDRIYSLRSAMTSFQTMAGSVSLLDFAQAYAFLNAESGSLYDIMMNDAGKNGRTLSGTVLAKAG